MFIKYFHHIQELYSLMYYSIYYICANKDKDKGLMLLSILEHYIKEENDFILDVVPDIASKCIILRMFINDELTINYISTLPQDYIDFVYNLYLYKEGVFITGDQEIYKQVYTLRMKFSKNAYRVKDLSLIEIAASEKEHTDYLGSLYRCKKFKLLMQEYITSRLWSSCKKKKVSYVLCPKVKSNNEAGIRFLLLSEHKNIIFSLNLYNKETIYGYLESTPLLLQRVAMTYDKWSSTLESNKNIYSHSIFNGLDWGNPLSLLWDCIFSSRIINAYDANINQVNGFSGNTLHNTFQNKKIVNLSIIPSAWLISLPLSAAYNKKENKYAIEYYDIAYRTDFKKTAVKKKSLNL